MRSICLFQKLAIVSMSILSMGSIAAVPLPSWVAEPPSDTELTYYGVGQGSTLAKAKQAALESIAGKLFTQIQSTFIIDITVRGDVVKENIQSYVRSVISNTRLSRYTVVKIEKIKRDFWVQLSINKEHLYRVNLDALQDLETELTNRFKSMPTESVLRIFTEQGELSEKLTAARNKLLIASAMNQEIDYTAKSNQISIYQEALRKKINQLLVYVKADKEMMPLAQNLADKISTEGMAATVFPPSRRVPTITLSGIFRSRYQFDRKYTSADVLVEVVDEFGDPVASRTLRLNGSSIYSDELAKNIAVNRLLAELDQSNLLFSLGLVQVH